MLTKSLKQVLLIAPNMLLSKLYFICAPFSCNMGYDVLFCYPLKKKVLKKTKSDRGTNKALG